MSATIQYSWGVSGQTVQVKMFIDEDVDALPAATINMPEKVNEPGVYKAITSLQGLYKGLILVNGAEWEYRWINIPTSGYAEFEQSRSIADRPPADYSPPPISPFRPA